MNQIDSSVGPMELQFLTVWSLKCVCIVSLGKGDLMIIEGDHIS